MQAPLSAVRKHCRVIRGIAANAGGHELFNRFDWLDTAPGSGRRAIQCGRSTAEIELPFEGPILQQAIDKPGVEDISRAGSIDHRNIIGRAVV